MNAPGGVASGLPDRGIQKLLRDSTEDPYAQAFRSVRDGGNLRRNFLEERVKTSLYLQEKDSVNQRVSWRIRKVLSGLFGCDRGVTDVTEGVAEVWQR